MSTESVEEIVSMGEAVLMNYHNRSYAERYRTLVDRAAIADWPTWSGIWGTATRFTGSLPPRTVPQLLFQLWRVASL